MKKKEFQRLVIEGIKSKKFNSAAEAAREIKNPWSGRTAEEYAQQAFREKKRSDEIKAGRPMKKTEAFIKTEAGDYYIRKCKAFPNGWLFTGDEIARISKSYSKYGDKNTQEEIALKFTLSLHQAKTILRSLKHYHSSLPFSDDEIEQGSVEDLSNTMLEFKEAQILKRFRKKHERKIEVEAEFGRRIDLQIKAMVNALEGFEPPRRNVQATHEQPSSTTIINVFDSHIGKIGIDGKVQRLSIDKYLKLIDSPSVPTERIIVIFGGDVFHCDTTQKSTTRGTRQDSVDYVKEIELVTNDVFRLIAELDRRTPRLEVMVIEGNHDRRSSVFLAKLIERAGYMLVGRIDNQFAYAVEDIGSHTIVANHGEIKPQRLVEALPRLGVDLRERVHVFTGHLHHRSTRDFGGVILHQVTSDAGSDRWHHQQGYISGRAGISVAVFFDDGTFAEFQS
jgi:hypothetical protein